MIKNSSKNEMDKSLKVIKFKTKENFNWKTAKIWLDNAILDCKVEEIEEEVLFLNNKIKGLEEQLKEEIITKKEN